MIFRNSIWIATLWVAAQLHGQTPSFTFATQTAGTAAVPVSVNGGIQLPVTAVGASSSVTLIINSTYPTQWTVSDVKVTGTGFAAGGTGTPVPAGGTAAFLITTTPTVPGNTKGTLTVTLSGPAGATFVADFNLSATAVSNVLVSYIVNPNGNQTLIADGGTLAFPQTPVGSTVAATMIITNRTPGTVVLSSILLLGATYQLSGVPLLPAQIGSNSELRFTLTFTPTNTTPATGTLTISIGGIPQTISLTGQGTLVSFTYEYGTGSSTTPVSPGGAIPLGSAAVNSGQNRLTMIVRNKGNLAGQISGMFVNTQDFALQDLPSFPATVSPGGSLSFTVIFAPKSVGNLNATLSIGNSTFALTGTGLGSNLAVTLIVGTQKTLIPSGATATLPNTSIGSKLSFQFQVDNIGNQPATITAMGLVGTNISTVGPPALPLTIAAGASVLINGVFAPTSTGIVNGFLQLQDQTYGLRVTGDPPPALPVVTFVNVTPQMAPLLQPALGLTLAKAYPFDLTGVVNIGFAADTLGDDPNVQFIAGARFVTFRIPADSTQALFGSTAASTSTTAPFQTGTTSGVITISAGFALGTYDVTAGTPLKQTVTVAAGVPVIRSVEIGSESATSVTLIITGYSTPRSMKGLVFQFTPATGAALQTTTLTADVTKDFDTWFQSTAGVSFGSQFSVTVQLNVNGALSAISSVAVSATNSQGTSAAKSLALN